AQAVDDAAQLDRAIFEPVVRAEHEYISLILIGRDRAILDQDCFVLAAAEQLNPREEPGGEDALSVGEYRADANGAGRGVDLVVDEVDVALVRKSRFVGEPDAYRIRRVA